MMGTVVPTPLTAVLGPGAQGVDYRRGVLDLWPPDRAGIRYIGLTGEVPRRWRSANPLNTLVETVVTIAIAVGVAILIQASSSSLPDPSSSIKPTLKINQRVLVNRLVPAKPRRLAAFIRVTEPTRPRRSAARVPRATAIRRHAP